MKTTKQQRINQVLATLEILKNDFRAFDEWESDENWETMAELVEILEKQVMGTI